MDPGLGDGRRAKAGGQAGGWGSMSRFQVGDAGAAGKKTP